MGASDSWGLSLHVQSAMSDPLRPYGLQPPRLLCPWDLPGKNTGAGSHFLLQRIFLTQGLKTHLFTDRRIFTTGMPWQATPLHLAFYSRWQEGLVPIATGSPYCW